jgi:hypothetical protein
MMWIMPVSEETTSAWFSFIYLFRWEEWCMDRGRSEREIDDIDEEETEDICAGCGMERSEWKGNRGRGYTKNGQIYCCQDCAEDIECNCGK